MFDVAQCSILKCTAVTWRADPSSNSACRTLPVGLCVVSESTNSHLGQHRGPVLAPSWYPDPHTACLLLRELLWTGKPKKCFCQACGGVPTVTPKAVLGNDLRPIGQEVASDHRSHFLQDTHARTHTHARMPSHTRARTHNIRNAYSRPSFRARRVHATSRRCSEEIPFHFISFHFQLLAGLLCVGHVTSVRSPVFTCRPYLHVT